MNIIIPDSLEKLYSIFESFTANLTPFINTIINFVTTPIYDVIYDIVTFFPLGDFFGAPFLLVCYWLFGEETLLYWVFGVGIGVYLFWNIAYWVAKTITSHVTPP